MPQILFTSTKTINYDEESNEVYINGRKVEDLDGKSANDYAYGMMRDYYKKELSCHIENFVILSGAGTSVGIGKENKGKTMKMLWESVRDSIGKDKLKEFCDKVKFDYKHFNTDLEALLSKANIAKEFIDDMNIQQMINSIETIIRKDCTLELPEFSPHELFLKKATARKLKYPRLKVFTLNYDTLFEQAASKNGYIVIDGFSFSYPRKFNGQNFDYDFVVRSNSRISNEENYVSRVFHLYKPHGSLDWERENDYIKKSEKTEKPVMIYPKDSKYEASYEQPFFEMMSRFQQELRKPNTYLITIGFSYYDKHITSMILEAININPSIRLMVVSPDVSVEGKYTQLKEYSKDNNNVTLINEKFDDFSRNYPYSEIYQMHGKINIGDGHDE